MRNFLSQTIKWAPVFAALFTLVVFASCNNDDDDGGTTPTLIEDGFYVNGDANALADFDIKSAFATTKNEVPQEIRNELFEAFVFLNAGSFNIVQVAGADRTTWGPGADFATIEPANTTTDEPKNSFQRGSLEVTDNKFTVPSDGLYHVVIDTEVGVVVVSEVNSWGLIGAATPLGWGGDTEIPQKSASASEVVYEISDVAMKLGDFKFRYGGGWKIEIDTTYDLGGGDKGIKVNTNFGGSVDALEAGGDNITNSVSGFYTATMTWTAGSGFSATLTKTGDLPLTDYSNDEIGLVGDGLNDMGAQHNWDVTLYTQLPAIDGTTYTWSYPNVEVNTMGSFKIREGQNWDNISLGFNDVILAGDGAADFETNSDGNFVPKVDAAKYDMELVIDAAAETNTFTITKI